MVNPTVDDAIAFLIDSLRNPKRQHYSSYGYDIYLANTLFAYRIGVDGAHEHQAHGDPRTKAISPVFYETA